MKFSFWLGQREYEVRLEAKPDGSYDVWVGDQVYSVEADWICRDELLLKVGGKVFNVVTCPNTSGYWLHINGRTVRVEKKQLGDRLKGEKIRHKKRDVKITMPGRVIQVLAAEGDTVSEGQPVLIVEAMKMQNEIKSPGPGRLAHVNFSAGDYVEAGSILFSVE